MKTTAKKPKKQPKRLWHGKPRGSVERKANPETVRKCIVSGEVLPVEKLIRFGVSPDKEICPDLANKLPGRGIWITADRDAVQTAVTKGLFRKAARAKVSCADDLTDRIDALFVKRIQSLLGFARKAGQVVTGFEKVEAALTKGCAAYVLQASDGSIDGCAKIKRLCGDVPVYTVLTADEMAQAVGAGICVHAALTAGGAAENLVAEIKRLAAFRQKEL